MDCETKITKQRLEELAQRKDKWCLSIYVPIGAAGEQAKRGRIELKNLIDESARQLKKRGVDEGTIKEALRPLHGLAEDHKFWLANSPCIAFFIAPGYLTCFRVPRLSNSIVSVGPHFNIVPLVGLADDQNAFYLLSLEQNRTCLYRGNAAKIEAVDIPGMPPDRDESIGSEQFEKETEHMKQTPSGRRTLGGSYHGIGPRVDAKKLDAQRYLQRVANTVDEYLKGQRVPLVLAGVPFLISGYREASDYQSILDAAIDGNVRGADSEETLEKCLKLLGPKIEERENGAFTRYQEIKSKKTGATSIDIKEITQAAYIGKVDELFIDKKSQLWGKIETHDGMLEAQSTSDGDTELVSTAAAEAFLHKARLHVVEKSRMPDEGSIAAVFRP